MNRKKLNPSEADLLNSISESDRWKKAIGIDVEDTTGWLTKEEVLKFIGYKERVGMGKIRKAVEQGKIESKKFKVSIGHSVQTIPFYRIPE